MSKTRGRGKRKNTISNYKKIKEFLEDLQYSNENGLLKTYKYNTYFCLVQLNKHILNETDK